MFVTFRGSVSHCGTQDYYLFLRTFVHTNKVPQCYNRSEWALLLAHSDYAKATPFREERRTSLHNIDGFMKRATIPTCSLDVLGLTNRESKVAAVAEGARDIEFITCARLHFGSAG